MPRRKIDPLERTVLTIKIRKDYLRGKSIREVADMHGISYATAREILKKTNTPLRGIGRYRNG